MQIKEYQEEDRERVIDFVSRLRQEIYGSPPKNTEDLENISEKYHLFLLVEDNKRLVGTCGLFRTDYGGEIKRIYLEKKIRRRGIGKLLINRIFDYAQANNISRINLFTYENNSPAIEFFSRVGFIRTKTEKGRVYFTFPSPLPF